MTKCNKFIAAALEELGQEVADGEQTPIVLETPAVAAAQTGSTEVNVDQSVDAVAALMEKNAELATEDGEVQQQQTFDNDTAASAATASDSEKEDLDEAVAVGTALEELATLTDLTVKAGYANKASVALAAFALEQITDRIGLTSPIAALESVEGKEPAEQLASIAQKAEHIGVSLARVLNKRVKK